MEFKAALAAFAGKKVIGNGICDAEGIWWADKALRVKRLKFEKVVRNASAMVAEKACSADTMARRA